MMVALSGGEYALSTVEKTAGNGVQGKGWS